jgi:hypothetical protein
MKRQGRQAQRRDGRRQTMVWYDPDLWERAQELGLFVPGSHTRGFGGLVNRLLREEVARVEAGLAGQRQRAQVAGLSTESAQAFLRQLCGRLDELTPEEMVAVLQHALALAERD